MTSAETPRLRRDILIRAQQLAQEIDDVEDELESYRGRDLPAFNAWFEGRFDEERAHLAELERRLSMVVQRHNSIVTLAKMHGLSLELAQRMIAQEETAYLYANLATRRRIEIERATRDQFIRAELEREVADRLGDVGGSGPAHVAVDVDADTLKVVYRKLVRRLHPDLSVASECPNELRWQRRVWSLLQAAYARGDARTLGDLYRVTLLRQMDFAELSVADAREAFAWLRRELDALTVERDRVRTRPAWGFANVTCLERLTDRVREEFRLDAESIRSEIDEIEGQHEYLDLLNRGGARREAPLDPRPRPARRRNKTDAASVNQMSFFD